MEPIVLTKIVFMPNIPICSLLFLTGIISLSLFARAQEPGVLDSYNVVWNTPSQDSGGSMPVGNGDIALNVWIEKNGDLLFYIGKNDAWSGDTTAPSYGAYGLLKVGKVRVTLTPNPFVNAQGFKQELWLRDGTFEVSSGTEGKKSRMTIWVDANRPVIHVEAACAVPVQMKAVIESWRTHPTEWLGADTILSGKKNRVLWYYRSLNKAVPQLVNRTSGAAILGEGFSSKSLTEIESATAKPTQHLAVHVLTAQTATPEEWIAKLDQQISNSAAVPLENARKEHNNWWEQFWDRSHVFITGGEKAKDVTTGYILQRFKNACTSRGEFPIKFNGSLFVIENPNPSIIKDKAKIKPDVVVPITPDYRGWGYQYWFQNTRPIYWPMMASGDFDLMKPFFKMYRDMLPGNQKLVREFYGHDGAYFRETGPFWGGLEKITPKDGGNYTKHYYTPILEYSAMALDYYAYTQDKEFAKDILIPMADAGVTFFDKHFIRDARGKLYISPANAIEMYWKVNNPLPDVAGLHWVLGGLLSLPPDLGTPAMREHWQKLLAELPPIPVGDRDGKMQILPHDDPPAGRHNQENPELYAVYPFRIYGLGKPDFEIAKNTFAARKYKWAGCWAQTPVQSALLGDIAAAKSGVIKHLTARDRRLRFPAFWPKGFDYPPDEDNGGNGLHTLQTMLIQFDGKKILVLPTWPGDWDVDFKLHAPYHTTVSGIYKQGKLVSLQVDPPERRKDVQIGSGTTAP